ncbi:fasciclin domain-containing protein [Spirosoma soli]|uniref:Fasciclin domain-containing protein n=1 Tax=Spirosoma soli TaxID=1770529 RepID=A0ABW5M8C1_9BACT
MKINKLFGLLTLIPALVCTASLAQTTPTGTINPTTYPQGAIAPDSTLSSKMSRSQKRAMRRDETNRNKKAQNTRNSGSASNTSTQDGEFRESSASNGTTINNSNSTNYNSNNVTNAPTGVGSNPTTTANPAKPEDQAGNGNMNTSSSGATGTNVSGTSVSTSGTTTDSQLNNGATKTGTAAAISGARTTEEPAVKSGSTVRNASIGDFISSSPNYVTLQNALQSVKLDETLKGNGPYTLFAPSNSAFKKLPPTIQGGLLEGRNVDALKQLLSYHVVNGSLDANQLTKQINAGNGKASLKTLAGGTLTAQLENGRVVLTDERGAKATVEAADNRQVNGIVHGINAVLMPKVDANTIR